MSGIGKFSNAARVFSERRIPVFCFGSCVCGVDDEKRKVVCFCCPESGNSFGSVFGRQLFFSVGRIGPFSAHLRKIGASPGSARRTDRISVAGLPASGICSGVSVHRCEAFRSAVSLQCAARLRPADKIKPCKPIGCRALCFCGHFGGENDN